MSEEKSSKDLRLIEAGFPCHQVGAETQRERGASSALPPLYFLHVWWARRPLTPSRAAILASLLPADTDPEWFLRQLGIERLVVELNGVRWTLDPKDNSLSQRRKLDPEGKEQLEVDTLVISRLAKENARREVNRALIERLRSEDLSLQRDPILERWLAECQPIPTPWPRTGDVLPISRLAGDPAWANERIDWENAHGIRTRENKYGYDRAYLVAPSAPTSSGLTVLDPTAGGGSIPFEALRLGHSVIVNELNPVASLILHATLEYPRQFGTKLIDDIAKWGNNVRDAMVNRVGDLFPSSPLTEGELASLKNHSKDDPSLFRDFSNETLNGFIYCRQVTCVHCHGEAPLLNTCWLSKEAGKQWGVRIVPDGRPTGGRVRFETYRAQEGKGPGGEDPNFATVSRGVGTCIHCRQAIDAEEIKRQARGESPFGRWKDRLYCVVAVRFQPKLDKEGQPLRYKSGTTKGQIKTQKIRFYRPPNDTDLRALEKAEERLRENWDRWDAMGLIPTEKIPLAHKTKEPIRAGMARWCDMFTPRQLLGHLTLVEELNRLKPQIMAELGDEKGKAVVTYLQFAIDKVVDYNSRQTRWITQRAQVSGTFGRHDYSLKWTFAEMMFTGSNSGADWGLSQILDAYKGIAELVELGDESEPAESRLQILNGTAAHSPEIEDSSVDAIILDPPYYNNVQYAELSDYYYVWERRTLKDLYPALFSRRLTNKQDEAVANPDRHSGAKKAKETYQRMMQEIFKECRRVIKDRGIMTVMFTHKTQDAWEALTRSLIESGWTITATFPVESEFAHSQHIMERASASSSVFIACRKRKEGVSESTAWTGFGGTGVAQRIRIAVAEGLKEFASLKLNPVDEMVSSYGRALRVLSEKWPVMDGDEPVGPLRAMNEASRVVSEHQVRRITRGRLRVGDLSPETAMALTLYGIYGLAQFPYDEALNLSRSLNIALESRSGGYIAEGRFIGINSETVRRTRRARAEEKGFHAPLARKGSKLRLVMPEERDPRRLAKPQTEWDILHGTIIAFRKGDIPVARGYLERHAQEKQKLVLDLLEVWTTEMSDEALRREGQTMLFGLKP